MIYDEITFSNSQPNLYSNQEYKNSFHLENKNKNPHQEQNTSNNLECIQFVFTRQKIEMLANETRNSEDAFIEKHQFYWLELQSYKTKEVNHMAENAGTAPRTFRSLHLSLLSIFNLTPNYITEVITSKNNIFLEIAFWPQVLPNSQLKNGSTK